MKKYKPKADHTSEKSYKVFVYKPRHSIRIQEVTVCCQISLFLEVCVVAECWREMAYKTSLHVASMWHGTWEAHLKLWLPLVVSN